MYKYSKDKSASSLAKSVSSSRMCMRIPSVLQKWLQSRFLSVNCNVAKVTKNGDKRKPDLKNVF